MTRLSREELKQVQLDTLDALVGFCEKNDIRISIASGTLIGAVRHKGYIPWDDDIDVFMPREDYCRFEKLFPEKYGKEGIYKLASIYREPSWHLTFAKLYDDRTITELDSRATIPYGVFVDIFPIDDVPDDEKSFKNYMKKLGWMRFLLNDVRKTTEEMGIMRKIGISLHHAMITVFPHLFLMKIKEKYIQIHNNKGYSMCYANSYGPLQPHPFPKSMFDDIILWDFEGRKEPGFRDADQFLTLQYGNYMQLPPEEKRQHHSEIAYWK